METPKQITLDQAKERMREYIRQQTYRGPDNVLRHKCGTATSFQIAYLSMHDSRFFDCSGSGRCETVPIPYCPACEPVPEDTGCVHVPGGGNFAVPFLEILDKNK